MIQYSPRTISSILILLLIFTLSACGAPEQEMADNKENYCAIAKEDDAKVDCFSAKCALGLTDKVNELATQATVDGSGGVFTYIFEQMRSSLMAGAEAIHGTLSKETAIGGLIKTCVVLAIMIFGVSVIFGIVDTTPYTTAVFIVKIVIVYAIATSWELLEFSIISWVEAAIDGLGGKMYTIFAGVTLSSDEAVTTVLTGIDDVSSRFLSMDFWKLIIAVAVTGVAGILTAAMLVLMVFMYIIALMAGLKVLITAAIVRAFFYGLAPIFFTFKLFKLTEDLFDAWIEQIVNWSLQPIFTFAFLGIFNLMIFEAVTNDIFIPNPDIFADGGDYAICWKEWTQLGNIVQLHSWKFEQLLYTEVSANDGWEARTPINFWGVISVLLLSWIMMHMIGWAAEFASKLSGGFISSKQIPAHSTGQGKLAAKSVIGTSWAFFAGGKDKRGVRRAGVVEGTARKLTGRGSGSVFGDAWAAGSNRGNATYRKHVQKQARDQEKANRW